jgi:hypothetical protein
MIDDFYQAGLAALRHHLDEASADYSLDDGEIVVDGHRLGLSITFDGFVTQGEHTLAPLDIQIHLDGDSGDRFRVGTLGIGTDRASAMHEAIAEWHLLAAAPLLAALGAPLENRRGASQPQSLAGWDLFAGRVGIRGKVPPELRMGSVFYRALLERLRKVVAQWEQPSRFELRSVYFMAACGPEGSEVQAAVDGLVNDELIELFKTLPWPQSGETYLYKQLFVLRSQGPNRGGPA